MSRWKTLLRKDLLEHGTTAMLLSAGAAIAALISLSQNQSGVFSMSPLEVVRFSLLGIIPLIAFIVGSRLITREYMDKTRLFVEALPVRNITMISTKYFTGLVFLSLLSTLVLIIAAYAARTGDDVDLRYFLILLARTLSFVCLIWSVVFCFSFSGALRGALYVAFIGIIVVLAYHPGFQESRLGPFALMDAQIFAFERFEFPWQDLLETLLIAGAFTVLGFALALINEGSVAEMLAKPLSRRDYVALLMMILAALTVFGSLAEDWLREPYFFSDETVVRHTDPPVSVLYLEEEYRPRSRQILDSMVQTLSSAQAALGIKRLPRVRISLDTGLAALDTEIETVDGVLVRSDFRGNDSYAGSELQAVVLHEVFQQLTTGRMSFEPNHWILDGFSRWWAESQVSLNRSAPVAERHHSELISRAVFTHRHLPLERDLMLHWQRIADAVGYPSAEALAYSAMVFLAEQKGAETVVRLGTAFLTEPVESSSLTSLRYLWRPTQSRFEALTALSWSSFHLAWQEWLEQQLAIETVANRLGAMPDLTAQLVVRRSDAGVPQLKAIFVENNRATLDRGNSAEEQRCHIRFGLVTAFDSEVDPNSLTRQAVACQADSTSAVSEIEHAVDGLYSSGDRVYVALEFLSDQFRQPLRLWAGRVNIP